jgi:putative DNA methylase
MHNNKTFLETQFPVSKLSKESYKERKANYSQTLTGLGKWWGRKPLILVRAAIIGLLMPSTDNPQKDREIFFKILTMDDEGLRRRKSKNISLREIHNCLKPEERQKWFTENSNPERPKYKKGISYEDKKRIQIQVFKSLSYDEKLTYCNRPEQIDGPSEKAWNEINSHLGTHAHNLQELVQELGKKRFDHIPRVGDAFCGGGSVPFEAARLGCEAYSSDLNPVAALLTWGALNIIGGGKEVAKQVREAQEAVFKEVDRQITEWGVEHNEQGWRADAYLYCNETKCPECGWIVPLAPSWVIGEKTHTIAQLVPDEKNQRFHIEIHESVSKDKLKAAKDTGTVKNSRLHCPHCDNSTPISAIRGDKKITKEVNGKKVTETLNGLRLWENHDLVPRRADVFQERLYCIRWVETIRNADDKIEKNRYYQAPGDNDLKREEKVLAFLEKRCNEWQEKGYIPKRRIESGYNTDQLIRERGWTHWHHLFNPRQLLIHGLCIEHALSLYNIFKDKYICTNMLFWIGTLANRDSKTASWVPSYGVETTDQVFVNQALNTKYNWAARGIAGYKTTFNPKFSHSAFAHKNYITAIDSRLVRTLCDIWLTDPPYADAINYHELSDFFLAWYEKHLTKLFPDWYTDSKRALAIIGTGSQFRKSMVDSYRNLANHMPDNGFQVVMFTHQDSSVWADLALILWASGLRVTAAWTIATETESALKAGNYVQGTVLMVLRKQTSEEVAFLDEIFHEVEVEVEIQLKSMLDLDDKEDPNFTDSDYQLAAYAAALRVLTQYKGIEDIDISHELSRESASGESSPIEKIIDEAVKTASNYLIPHGLDDHLWKSLSPEEKFYLKGLEVESHGDYRNGVYQEFARGFGVREYRDMLESGKANQTRLKTASEFRRKELGDTGFGRSLIRNALFAVFRAAETEEAQNGLKWLKDEVHNYWPMRDALIKILRYLASMTMEHWKKDAEAARLLAGAVENDHV